MADFLDWNLWGGWPGGRHRSVGKFSEPTVDLYETNEEVIVEADVPGYDPSSISIKVSPQSLTMVGKTDDQREEKGEGYYLRERGFGRFSRTVGFPTEVMAGEALAKYRDGVLRVTVPKARRGDSESKDVPIQRE